MAQPRWIAGDSDAGRGQTHVWPRFGWVGVCGFSVGRARTRGAAKRDSVRARAKLVFACSSALVTGATGTHGGVTLRRRPLRIARRTPILYANIRYLRQMLRAIASLPKESYTSKVGQALFDSRHKLESERIQSGMPRATQEAASEE